MTCTDEVRETCRAIATGAVHVRIVPEAIALAEARPAAALDGDVHFTDGPPADVAAYVLVLDAVNFGSGWFADTPGLGYEPVARALTERWRADGPLDAGALRALTAPDVAAMLCQPPSHELMALYARALRELGTWLGQRSALDVVRAAEPSAQQLTATLASALPMWRDHGFLKRAQIAASDLAHAGVARFSDLHRLTAFADNVLPQVLRHDGVLELDEGLAAGIDRGELLAPGTAERELRACAVHACELICARLQITARELDNVLWTRGQQLPAAAPRAHRTHTWFY